VPLYDLPLWACDPEQFPDDGIHGQGWRAAATKIPVPSFGDKPFDEYLSSMRERYPGYTPTYLCDPKSDDKSRAAPQIYIEARSRIAAQRAFDLIRASLMIIDGCPLLFIDDQLVIPQDLENLEDLTKYDLRPGGRTARARYDVLLATKIAAKLSRRRYLQYAAYKLQQSLLTASADYMDLQPNYYRKQFYVANHPHHHVQMSTAITLAYSAIEELHLEPRPIDSKPIKLPNGSWEPLALASLNNRLEKAGIDLKASLVWTVRGSPTRIDKSRRAPSGNKQSWSRGLVRDKAVTIQDALVASSWMRSRCTTHRYTEETKSISMFDVHNVQFLVRRLLLERIGIWKYFFST
jgi:hypothetical protein